MGAGTTEKKSFSNLKKELNNARNQLVFAIVALFALSAWYSVSTVKIHQEYQQSLMHSVTRQVINEYHNHISKLRQQLDKFQWRYQKEFMQLYRQGNVAERQDYLALLKMLRSEVEDVRLFSLVDLQGQGVFEHITGKFLPDCKEEIYSTIKHKGQEQLFLHRNGNSVHYDLLQPMLGGQQSIYMFVAFEPTVFKDILENYRQPQQELFLLREDGKVEIELTQGQNSQFSNVVMSEADVSGFTILEKIPETRWNIAIRLSDSYLQSLQFNNYFWPALIWVAVSLLLTANYFSQKKKSYSQLKALKQLEFTKSHDSLTGLITRQSFADYFESLKSTVRVGYGAAFVIDIDKFQVFNNAVGFTKGDLALREVANFIKESIPRYVKVSRVSNDQFGIIHPTLNHIETMAFAEHLRQCVENIDVSGIVDNFSLTACVGAINISEEISDSEHLMSSLLLTIKLAKSKGRNQVMLYQSDDPELIRHATEMEIYHTVQSALNDSNFQLYRQEITPVLANTEFKSYEILVRMFDSQGNMVSPAQFIPIAEQHSLATDLDRWVIQNAFENIVREKSKDHYSINLSGQTLAEPSMISFVREQIQLSMVNPENITFEITETFAITHLESATAFISEISALGCRFALDDFGSGLSSFSYLQQLPVQKLKIDGVFIRNITENPRNQDFVRTMVTLAKSMEMETVAEFVETQEEYEMLKELGLDYCQGYFFHKPEPWLSYRTLS